jgi:hypothetical protein
VYASSSSRRSAVDGVLQQAREIADDDALNPLATQQQHAYDSEGLL